MPLFYCLCYDLFAWDVPRETKEFFMATSKVESFELTTEDIKLIVSSIALKMQSVQRAAKGEANLDVAELRRKEYAALNALALRFSK